MIDIQIAITGAVLDFDAARAMAEALARQGNPETMLVAWFDRKKDTHSPCCVKCQIGEKPGWEVYGENHQGRLKIIINEREYVFIYS